MLWYRLEKSKKQRTENLLLYFCVLLCFCFGQICLIACLHSPYLLWNSNCCSHIWGQFCHFLSFKDPVTRWMSWIALVTHVWHFALTKLPLSTLQGLSNKRVVFKPWKKNTLLHVHEFMPSTYFPFYTKSRSLSSALNSTMTFLG